MAAAVLASSPTDLGAMAERLARAPLLSPAFWCNESIVGRWAGPPGKENRLAQLSH